MLTQRLLSLADQLAPHIAAWPRRQPGLLMVGDRALKYADLHSLYFQVRQIFGDGLYQFTCDTASPYILDCGAHVGIASLFFKELYPKAEIVGFEADPQLCELARSNLASFGHNDVKVEDAAIWTHDDGVQFASTSDDSGYVADSGSSQKVRSIRLRSLLETRPIDLLKLDVEGAEFDLIADCRGAMGNVRRLIAEVHAMAAAPAPIGTLLATLEDEGFRYVLSDLHAAKWIQPAGTTPFKFCPTDRFIFTVYAWR